MRDRTRTVQASARLVGYVARRLRTWSLERRPLGSGIEDDRLRLELEAVSRAGGTRVAAPIGLLRAVSWFLRAAGFDRANARVWVRAVRSAPGDPAGWLSLAAALQFTGVPGPVMRTGVGLTLQSTASTESATFALERAIELGPLAAALSGAADAARSRQDHTTALELSRRAIDEFPEDGAAWTARARVLAADAQQAGGLTPDDVAAVRDAWQQAFDIGGPAGERARVHLLRHLIRFGDWNRAFSVADPGATLAPREADEIKPLVDDQRFRPSADWWYVAWWRLQTSARSREGWAARQREADRRLDASRSAFAPFDRLQVAVQCLIILGRPTDALRLIERAQRLPDAGGRLRKLRADVLLRLGDPSGLVTWSAEHSTGLPPGPERWFSEMTRNRRLAILGPHATPEERVRAAAAHDVVLDTKQLEWGGLASGSAHVSYYADTSAALFADAIVDQLQGGSLDGAVLRPTALGFDLATHPRVRVMSSEDSLGLGVSHFGIGRIVYDVLRYSPRTVTLVGVDLFTSATEYPESYLRDKARYEGNGFARVLPRFNHDVADDFVMLSCLHACGVISADPSTATVLMLSLDEYLSAVDTAAIAADHGTIDL